MSIHYLFHFIMIHRRGNRFGLGQQTPFFSTVPCQIGCGRSTQVRSDESFMARGMNEPPKAERGWGPQIVLFSSKLLS